jgi:hypothetical protein
MATPLDPTLLRGEYQQQAQARSLADLNLQMQSQLGPLKVQSAGLDIQKEQAALALQQQQRGVLAQLANQGQSGQTPDVGATGRTMMAVNPAVGARMIIADARQKAAAAASASRPAPRGQIVQTDTGIYELTPQGLKPLNDPNTGAALTPKGSNPLGQNLNPGQAGAAPLTGDDFLKTLPPNIANQVKARAEGDIAAPTGFALKSPYFQQMMAAVQQYDPTYSDRRYSVKQDTLGKGKTKDTLTNLNQAVLHAGTLSDLNTALQNNDVPAINSLVNFVKTNTGQPAVTNASIAQQVLGTELMRTFRGAGAGSEQEAAAFDAKLRATQGSPEQQQGVLKTVASLLNGRMKVMGDQYAQGMGNDRFRRDLMVPSAQAAWAKIGGGDQVAAPAGQMTATNPKTGEKVMSSDGGKTWQPAK